MDLTKSRAACSPSSKASVTNLVLVAPSGYKFTVNMNINPTKFTRGRVKSKISADLVIIIINHSAEPAGTGSGEAGSGSGGSGMGSGTGGSGSGMGESGSGMGNGTGGSGSGMGNGSGGSGMEGGNGGEDGGMQCQCNCNCGAGPESCGCLCNCPVQEEPQLDIFSLVLNLVASLFGEEMSETVTQVLWMAWGLISSLLGSLREIQEEKSTGEAIKSVTEMVIFILNKLAGELQKRVNPVM